MKRLQYVLSLVGPDILRYTAVGVGTALLLFQLNNGVWLMIATVIVGCLIAGAIHSMLLLPAVYAVVMKIKSNGG